jgi:tRNA(Ile2)-agmatinylcytidine synthase
VKLHIGIDDTDSTKGGCTTYIAALLVDKLSKMRIEFTDYPNIIRLNPNVPYKTRGNAAVALRVQIPSSAYDMVRETVLRLVEDNSRLGDEGTDPAVVLLTGKPTASIQRLSRNALIDIVPLREAVRVLRGSNASAVSYGSGIGLVGALAAVGQLLLGDHTFELVAYRHRGNCGRPRLVDENSVKRMDQATSPETFNSYDSRNRRSLIAPHGPDPVLVGVRGETPEAVVRAYRLLTITEPVERWVIFRTNHGTNAHVESTRLNGPVRSNRPVRLRGIILDRPKRIAGGHVFFTLGYRHGSVQCAAFEPTGRFREIVAKLAPGDEVTVFGGAKAREPNRPPTVNLENLTIEYLNSDMVIENPLCPHCGKHMKSAGHGQGFRCGRCRIFAPNALKRVIAKARIIRPGLYLPDKKAHRHLTKPLSRYGFENRMWNGEPPLEIWHRP